MDLFYCNKCKRENIYYLIKKKGKCCLLRNCCYENFITNYELQKLKNIIFPTNLITYSKYENKKKSLNYDNTYKENEDKKKDESFSSEENYSDIDIESEEKEESKEINELDKILVNINDILHNLSLYKEKKEDNNDILNINEFKFTERKNEEKINFKEYINISDNYTKNILDIEKYLKQLEILKKEKIEFFINKYNKEKIELENKFNQLMISLEKKYNEYKYNIELFLNYYKSINEILINKTKNKKIDNNYLNSLSLNLNIYKFKDLDKLFSIFKDEDTLDCFVNKLNIYDNFIVKRKKLHEFIRNQRAFKTESYIFNLNEKYNYNYEYECKINELFDSWKNVEHALFYKENHFIYFIHDKLYFNNLIFENSPNSFLFFEKHFLKFEDEIKQILILKNDKILIICNRDYWTEQYTEIFLISINLEKECMIIEKSFKIEEIKIEHCQELNISNKILLKVLLRNKLSIILFNINDFPDKKIYKIEDILNNKYNNIVWCILKNMTDNYKIIPFIIEIKKNIIFFESLTKRYIFSMKNKQFITIIDKYESIREENGVKKYIIAEYEYIYFKDAILIFEQNSNNKIPWNRISYFIDIKTFRKVENNVPISDGKMIKFSENKFAIINNYNITIYMKIGLKLQIYEFYTFQFIDNEKKIKLQYSYNHLLTNKFINILIDNGYHPELKTSEIDYIEIDINSNAKGKHHFHQIEYEDIEKYMKCDFKLFKIKPGFIYLLKNYPKRIIKITKY